MTRLATEAMKHDLAQDGAIVVRELLTGEGLGRIRSAYEYGIANPSPAATQVFRGTSDEFFDDFTNPDNCEVYLAAIRDLGLADFAASLWGSEHVWYYGEELFIKSGGKAGRSPWHQDTSYLPVEGPHLLNIWISFEKLPRFNALEVVRGSHLGVQYDGTSYTDPNDPTRPVWGENIYPRLPDIEADRKKDPESWDIVSWDLEPGDALVFHSGALHGGAPVTPDCPSRHTLVLRFHGDKLYYRPLPGVAADYPDYDISEFNDSSMRPGDPYRSARHPQVR